MHRLAILALSLTLAACARETHETAAANTASTPPAVSSTAADEALVAATRAYVLRESAYQTIAIESTRVDADYARLFVVPVGVEGDPAIVFMKRMNGRWEGLSLGTGYAPDDLRAMGIPQSLWQD